MSDVQAGALAGGSRGTPGSIANTRQVGGVLLGFAALGALAFAAWLQWEGGNPSEVSNIEGPGSAVTESLDQREFDGRGKWGGYARLVGPY